MTTNQTIDGVPRELLERCARELSIGIGPGPKNRAQELRALLDAPEVLVVPLTGPKEWLDSLRPAAQPQGEPVAWRGRNADGEVVTEWIDGAPPVRMTDLCGNTARFDKIERAYPEQPAPVAVVVPERRELPPLGAHFYRSGWNACLGELKRLNPSL